MPAIQIATAFAALAAILALILLAGHAARARLAPRQASQAMRLRASLALDTRRRLHIVETDTGAVLILTGGATDQLLPWPSRAGAPPSP